MWYFSDVLRPRAVSKIAKGPQVKIKFHGKKKMKELGLYVEPKDDGKTRAGAGGGKDGEKGSEDMCHVCGAEEIKVNCFARPHRGVSVGGAGAAGALSGQ